MDYQLNRRKKNIFVLLTKCIGVDLALRVFLAEKSGGRRECFNDLRCIFYVGMREIVFFCNTVSSRYRKVEVHPKVLIFQSNFSGPR